MFAVRDLWYTPYPLASERFRVQSDVYVSGFAGSSATVSWTGCEISTEDYDYRIRKRSDQGREEEDLEEEKWHLSEVREVLHAKRSGIDAKARYVEMTIRCLTDQIDRLETRLAAIHARQNISLAKSNRSRQDDITPLRELPCLEVKAQNLWADSDATLGEGSLHRLSIDDPNNHNPDSWISAWARETMRTAPAQSCSPPLPPGPPVVSELPPM